MATHRSRTVADTRRGDRPPWRKRLARGALCLVFGAVTTVAVAWGLPDIGDRNARRVNVGGASQYVDVSVYTGSNTDHASITLALGDGFDEISVARGWGSWETVAPATRSALPIDDVGELTIVSALPEWIATPRMPQAGAAPGTVVMSTAATTRRGWPWRAVTAQIYEECRMTGTVKQTTSSHTVGSVRIGDDTFAAQPIFPGLALNILFYAVPCWLVVVTPGAIRRWRRRRRGRCVACGYDLHGLTVDNGVRTCPECGALDRARLATLAKA